MSDIQYIDVDDEDFEDAPRALREHVKKLQKRLTEVTTERDDFRGKWQSKSATDALADFRFRNTKRVSRDLLADGVDLSDADAVKAWVEENGDDYARVEQGQESNSSVQTEDHTAEQQARSQIAEATTHTQPAANDRMQAALAEITPNMTGDEVIAVYRKHGI